MTTTTFPAGRAAGFLSSAARKLAGNRVAVYVGAVSVVANIAILVLQQVSFRLLAPIIGSSVETWSTIIGVFLIGIALGNVVGGQIADRYRPIHSIRGVAFLGALCTLLMLGVAEWLKTSNALASLSLWGQILIASIAVSFPVSFVLSLLTPLAVKAVLRNVSEAGRAAGIIYALGTAGSLVGNYLTGFVLIPLLDTHAIVLGVAGGLFLLCIPRIVFASPNIAESDQPTRDLSESPRTNQLTSLPNRMIAAAGIVMLGGFVSGTLESAAFRMIAPLTGVSIFLSTGVVGVVLAGMALGNYVGGRLADSPRRVANLRACLGLAALFTLLIAPLMRWGGGNEALASLPIVPRVLLWSFSLFFVPSLLLGTISPQVIRLAVTDMQAAGRVAGRLYAWSTLGCVVGILATGWFLIELLGVFRLTVACGMLLLVPTYCLGLWSRGRRLADNKFAAGAAVVIGVAFTSLVSSPYLLETKYFSIQVRDAQRDGRDVKQLVLDRLVHSEVDLSDPNWLGYQHEAIQGELTHWCAGKTASPRVLVIGGGGYTFPKWVEHQSELDRVRMEVVEIDPGVTEVAHRELGFPRDTRVTSHHMDGRQFVKQSPSNVYDLVIQDAVNDYSVPYHLMTREYNDLVRRSLTPDGVYLLTVIDSLADGPFLRAAVRTMQASFPEVRLLSPHSDWNNSERSVYVIAGFPSADVVAACLSSLDGNLVRALPDERLTRLVDGGTNDGVVFTDRYAPVDSLMANAYLRSGGK